jgi:hypothetical protein
MSRTFLTFAAVLVGITAIGGAILWRALPAEDASDEHTNGDAIGGGFDLFHHDDAGAQ